MRENYAGGVGTTHQFCGHRHRRLRAGQVEINGGRSNAVAPFSGYGQSGYGRELGVHGLAKFLEIKSLQF